MPKPKGKWDQLQAERDVAARLAREGNRAEADAVEGTSTRPSGIGGGRIDWIRLRPRGAINDGGQDTIVFGSFGRVIDGTLEVILADPANGEEAGTLYFQKDALQVFGYKSSFDTAARITGESNGS
jgi:hypothetical protein